MRRSSVRIVRRARSISAAHAALIERIEDVLYASLPNLRVEVAWRDGVLVWSIEVMRALYRYRPDLRPAIQAEAA